MTYWKYRMLGRRKRGEWKKKDEFRFREKPDQSSDMFRNGLKC